MNSTSSSICAKIRRLPNKDMTYLLMSTNIDNYNPIPAYDLVSKYKQTFQNKISKLYETSSFIKKSLIIDEFFIQDDIKYLIKLLKIDEVSNKPIEIRKTEFYDPFNPPFPEGMLIDDNFLDLNSHRVLFSKFPLLDKIVLLVTRDFKSQYTHLEEVTFRDSIFLINLIDGCIFFNGGQNAGASQPRKHLQAAPYSSMYDKEFGLFSLIANKENLSEISFDHTDYSLCTIKKLNDVEIPHMLVKFSDKLISEIRNFNDSSVTSPITRTLFEVYNYCLNSLELISDDDSEVDEITNDYSFLLTHEWMLIVPRKANEVNLSNGILNLNSLAFFGIIVSRSEEVVNEIKNGNILRDVMAKL
jgi:ATP adenylyltransferase